MELTKRDVFLAREPLQKLMSEKFPVKTAYALAKLGIKLNESLAAIDLTRKGLIDKYVTKDERNQPKTRQDNVAGRVFDIPPEVEAKLNAEFNELLDETEKLVFEKVKLPTDNGSAGVEVTPVTLMALLKFVEA